MIIKILPFANEDLINGYYFYEQQQKGLGTYFLDSLFSDIDSLMVYHGIHRLYFGKYQRVLSKRFPFAVYYTVEGNDIVVHGVLDCRSDPVWIELRLDSK